MTTKKWVMRGTLVVLILALSLPAFALTGWKTFGTANATGRGYYGGPYISQTSSSKAHPKQVRLQVTSKTSGTFSTYISWTVFCWKGDFTSGTTSGSSTVNLGKNKPFTQTIKNLPVNNPLYCEITAYASSGENGNITMKQQAKYADPT